MSIDREMVKRLGILSRLRIPEENMDEMVTELTKILGWVDQLKDVNTDDVLPMNSVVEDMNLREREDVINDGGIRDQILANAPEEMDGYFLVPKVVE
ncbi:MAG: Asp-tRNA(Asn)/Glu-tRNA(Gln) amidotransferase subunit GatC [Alphaproteobacteria bacterium]|nr:Asp-tRNA(Asn)/Glu-tRNA(Gln) amidotransferase subunit GatC [Alphaproteobacteria bacterium]MBO4644516.1 Asp-tRNA(Asn)/Glu-tRNA(Gln) amidotransferase subunit GatC [Alphaproteobacteria bacterium]MBR1945126.1 Asp-tRNA(Asn)/Glu-tRNA(Gln) amidotransferase subunit GatC [Alphaproteobacteria bacterium]HCU33318.1 Asp-tRNA(Asn)/Glu-tRNA(Gln) amidotransferase GatCAB subunit C [Oscillospiraceae bacterium]